MQSNPLITSIRRKNLFAIFVVGLGLVLFGIALIIAGNLVVQHDPQEIQNQRFQTIGNIIAGISILFGLLFYVLPDF